MPTIRDTPLVGSAEAAKILKIGPTNFSHLRKKMEDAGDDSFPAPITKLQCGPIWLESDMVKFKRHYDARRRRPQSNGDAPEATPAAKTAKPTAKAAAAKAPTTKAPSAKTQSRAKNGSKAGSKVSDIVKPIKKLALAGKAS